MVATGDGSISTAPRRGAVTRPSMRHSALSGTSSSEDRGRRTDTLDTARASLLISQFALHAAPWCRCRAHPPAPHCIPSIVRLQQSLPSARLGAHSIGLSADYGV